MTFDILPVKIFRDGFEAVAPGHPVERIKRIRESHRQPSTM